MARHRVRTSIIFALFVVSILLIPSVALAAGPVLPVPVIGPRLAPPPIPHTSVIDPAVVWNNLLNPPKHEYPAGYVFKAGQEAPGRGVKQTQTALAKGISLYPQSGVCNDFNTGGLWALSADQKKTDQFTNWYAGWAPFALNDGLYQAKNTVFTVERVVGPGNLAGAGQYSAKISSNQPYAGGFGSPIIAAKPGSKVTVTVSYLIYDHDQAKYDWASMGIKADAAGDAAEYVNGYVRGEWAQLTNTITAGSSGQIMVLLQGESPASVNSNIYFDNVQISVDGAALATCTLAQ